MTTTTTITTTTTATTPDYDEIVRVVQLYIDGFKGDVDKFKEAFHEDAWIFFTDADGVLHKDLLTDCFERWAAANRHIEGRIISVTQARDVASVLLGYDIPQTRRAALLTSTRCCGSTASGKSRTRPPRTAVGQRGPRRSSPSVRTSWHPQPDKALPRHCSRIGRVAEGSRSSSCPLYGCAAA